MQAAALVQLGPTAATSRSCGTNAVVHQRSSSALVQTIGDAEGIGKHQRRSKSFLLFHHEEELAEPQISQSQHKPKPAGSGTPTTYAKSPPSILMQLAQVSPDLLSSLNATMTTPLDPTPKLGSGLAASASRQVKILSPVVARAKRKEQNAYHSRSVSMLDQRNVLGKLIKVVVEFVIANLCALAWWI